MSRGKKALSIAASAAASIAFAQAAHAGLTVTSYTGIVTGTAPGDYWPSAPTGPAPSSVVGFNPSIDSGDGPGVEGSPNDGNASGGVVQESVGSGAFSVLAQTFQTGASGFTLGEIAFVMNAGPDVNPDFSIHLFQLNNSVTPTSTGYALSSAEAVGTNDLLGGGSGLTFNFNGGRPNSIQQFVFSGSDEVSLLPNTEYAIELWGNQNSGESVGAFRNSGANPIAQPYTGGQAYFVQGFTVASGTGTNAGQSDHSSVARGEVAGSTRDLLFSLYQAPPTNVNATWTGASATNNSNWTDSTNWTGGVPGALPGDTALFTTGSSSTTADLNGTQTLGAITFNGPAYTIAPGTNSGSLVLENVNLTTAHMDDLFNSSTITAPISLQSSVQIAVGQTANTLTLSGAITGVGGITLAGDTNAVMVGTVEISGTNSYSGPTSVAGGELLVAPSGSATVSPLPIGNAVTITGGSVVLASNVTSGSGSVSHPASNVTLSSLTISGNGVFDIGNNHIILTYTGTSPMSTILGYMQTGYNNGAWNGTGIISSAAALQDSTAGALKYSIGWADGGDKVGDVAGLTSGEIELKYTLIGDANLDGSVNGSDFSILAANFGLGVTNWDQGNFLFGSSVNGSDFSALAANFGQGDSNNAVTVADVAALDAFAAANGLAIPSLSTVPEPASLGLLAIGTLALMNRRKRRH
jgi:autotransporter-associated beta strand protein